MSKKRDPLATVIQFFTTIDLAHAEQARVMVNEIVRSRQPPREAAKKKKTITHRAPAAIGEIAPV
jgi:hypothetical protein